MNCNGKCVLMKKLMEAEKKEKQQENQFKLVDLICAPADIDFTLLRFASFLSNYPPFLSADPCQRDSKIFTPPC